MTQPDPTQPALFDGYVPELSPEDPDRASLYDCCLHVEAYERMVRSSLGTIADLTGKIGEMNVTLRKGADHIRRQDERIAQDTQLLEELAGEKYTLQQELNSMHEAYQKLESQYQDQREFLSVLGFSKRLRTTDDKRRRP